MRRNLLFNETSSNDYLTMEALEDGMTVSFSTNTIQYSTNGGRSWTNLAPGSSTPAINTGQKISFKAEGLTPTSSAGIGTFTVSKKYNLLGNAMSMVYGDNTSNNDEILSPYQFFKLFYNNTTLQSVSKDFLPATVLKDHCYDQMFHTCSALTNVPDLPATELADYCYYCTYINCSSVTSVPDNYLPATVMKSNCYAGLFNGTGLKKAPNLPSMSMASRCYWALFYNCKSLTAAPTLPATNLATECYLQMFHGCTKLTTAPLLPATNLANYCYSDMFCGCTSLKNLPSNMLPATTMAPYCYFHLFMDCSALVTPPKLPATALATQCYAGMFTRCTSLTTAPALNATTLADTCYWSMFYGCTNLTTAPTLPATTLVNACYREMFINCSKLNYIKILATNVSASNCLYNWVSGVATTGTFIQSNSATWYVVGVSGIPVGWTWKNESGTTFTNSAIEKSKAVAGDILCANSSGNKIVVSAAKYNQIPNGYTPIGVVVIPPSHNVYGTGQGAAISLKNYVWTYVKVTDEFSHTNAVRYDKVLITDNQDPPTLSLTWGPSVYFASTNNTSGTRCVTDPNARYRHSSSGLYNPTPSPYNSDGGRNPYYGTSSYGDHACMLKNFPTPDINSSGLIHYCADYTTVGTTQGQWRMPILAEWGYVAARLKEINTTLTRIGVGLNTNESGSCYWAWEAEDSKYGYIMQFAYGRSTSSGGKHQIRPFLRF